MIDGEWSVTVTTGLGDGTYEVEATLTDGVGNSSSDTTAGELTIGDSTTTSRYGTANSDAALIIISGDLENPLIESYEVTTTTGRRKKDRVTTGIFTPITIDKTAPLDVLVFQGGSSDNTITANGFIDNLDTAVDETRSAFTEVVVIDGKGGADDITGGASGLSWMIGGGATEDTFDTLTGSTQTIDVFDLRREISPGQWADSYGIGHAVINNYDGFNDFIVLANDDSGYNVINRTVTNEITNRGGKVIRTETSTYLEVFNKDSQELIAKIYGSSLDDQSSVDSLQIIYGQGSQDPYSVINPDTSSTII